MHAGSASAALPRRLARTISPVVFRRVALAAVGVLILIVAIGATVRLTGSGLGCPTGRPARRSTRSRRATTRTSSSRNRVVSAVTDLHDARARGRRVADTRPRPPRPLAGDGRLRGDARAGAARRDHRLLRPQPVPRDHAPAALVHARRARGAHAARGDAARPRRGIAAALDRAARRARARRRRHGARDQRDGGDRCGTLPRELRLADRAAARLLLSRRLLARARRRRVRRRLPRARGLGVDAAQHVPVAAARLRGAARDPRRADGDRRGAVPDVRRRAVVARAPPRGDGGDARRPGRWGSPRVSGARSGLREATTRLAECRS